MNPKLRVLCLHGWTSSASKFSSYLNPLQRACEDVAELIFVDGCHAASITLGNGEETKGRAWWNMVRDGKVRYVGAKESFDFLHKTIQETGPYDGILGFSQGSAATGALCASLHDKIKFAVMLSGFLPRDESLRDLFPPKYAPLDVRSLHVCGEKDEVVRKCQTLEMAEYFKDPKVHIHAGGHIVPSDEEFYSVLKDFMMSALEHGPPSSL
uniref:Serine hydrolase domain-containing protein n=1 Tax=Lotharella globosa TaxID=91324 RepID=A0A7S3Z8J2_9EUKA|mmetsp:Transcript_10394/g.20029  ORF Transcript_10394/g.20029 Transcript_10394/m.20029 type:complete len:211 (+) Transcript_10394:1-633(+)